MSITVFCVHFICCKLNISKRISTRPMCVKLKNRTKLVTFDSDAAFNSNMWYCFGNGLIHKIKATNNVETGSKIENLCNFDDRKKSEQNKVTNWSYRTLKRTTQITVSNDRLLARCMWDHVFRLRKTKCRAKKVSGFSTFNENTIR